MSDHFLVKVSDFGLSRKLEEEDMHEEHDSGIARPIRWMAIESIRDAVYSTSTDVVTRLLTTSYNELQHEYIHVYAYTHIEIN